MYKYNMGGTVPRETTIGGQRHNLAYINPFEEDLLNSSIAAVRAMRPRSPVLGAFLLISSGFNSTGGGEVTNMHLTK